MLETDSVLRIGLRFGASGVTLERAVRSLLNRGEKQILLSLHGIRSIAANNLGQLISIHAEVTSDGGEFKLFGLTPAVRQLMHVTKLSDVLALYESEQDAIASFNHNPVAIGAAQK